MLALPPKQLAREGVPVAAILLFWNLLGAIAEMQNVGAVGTAGFVVATLYVVVRGAQLSSTATAPATGDARVALLESAHLAVPAGVWFVGAILVHAVDGSLYRYAPSLPATVAGSALAGAGLGVVGLYAVAAGFAAFRRDGAWEVVRADD